MRLKENTILLTGGTSGIGLELLGQLYNNNKMIVASSNKQNLEKLKQKYPNIETIECDLGKFQSVKNLIDTALHSHKDINILINNAAMQYNYNWNTEKDGYNKIEHETRVNFISPMQLIYGLLPILTPKRDAAIVNISSGLILAPKKTSPVYCATKSAIHSMTKSLRYQLEDSQVKVFELIPPLTDTAMTKNDGGDKISTKALVDEFLENFSNDVLESYIGGLKELKELQKRDPELVDSILKNG